jgi:hypothetical protein
MNTYYIDYSAVKTEVDLFEWAKCTFSLPPYELTETVKNSISQTVAFQIWDKLVEIKQNKVIIYESFSRHQSSEVKLIMNGTAETEGWKSILGFHFYREHLIHVRFEQNPKTKGKRPPKG